MAYSKQAWRDYDDTKTELQNMQNGAVVTPERLNHIETGIANSADKQEVAAQLAQTSNEVKKNFIEVNQSRPPINNVSIVKRSRPILSVVDDDGNRAVLTKLKPISEKLGVPFTIALVGSSVEVGSGVTGEEAYQLQEELGWEIASHSYSHLGFGQPGVTAEDIEFETTESLKVLRGFGLDVKNYVYPGGQYSDLAKQILSKYYNGAVSTDTRINTTPYLTWQLGRINFPGSNDYAYYKNQIDLAIENNGWLIFMTHVGQANVTPEAVQMLEDLLIYAQNQGVDILTVQEALDETGNAVDINDREYFMSSDGHNNMVNFVTMPINNLTDHEDLDLDMLPSEYPYANKSQPKLYVSSVSSGGNSNLPFGTTRGTAYVFIARPVYNSHRILVSRLGDIYISHSNDQGQWQPWEQILKTSHTHGRQTYVKEGTMTIEPSETVRFTINRGRYGGKEFVKVQPASGESVPDDIVVSSRSTGNKGTIVVHLTNTWTSPITLTDVKWDYFIYTVESDQ